jgi:hypothetical protein
MIAARNDSNWRQTLWSRQRICVPRIPDDTNEWRVSLEIQRRIQTANRCFFGLRKHLQSGHLSRQTKFTIHKTLIRPVLLYGSETWVLTCWPKICGPKIENCAYRRRYNHELDKEFNSPNGLNITKTSRLRYSVTWSEDPKTYHKKLYSEPNTMEGEIKEDRNPGGRMGWTAITWP